MWAAFLLGIVSAQTTTTITATSGAVDWNAAGSWSAGVPLGTTLTINILTGAQVYVNASLPTFAASLVLNLGTAGTTSTALILNGGASLGVATFSHRDGQLVINGGGSVNVVTLADFRAGATARQIVGGKFSLGVLGSATLDGSLTCNMCDLDSGGKTWTINGGGNLLFNGSANVSSNMVVTAGTGAGGSSVTVNGGASVSVKGSTTWTWNSGIWTTINGGVDLIADASVSAKGAVIVGATGAISGTSQSTFVVESSGNLTINGGIRGGTIQADGAVILSGTVTVSGPVVTIFTGTTGSFNLNGRLDTMTRLDVTGPTLQVGASGEWHVGAGLSGSFKAITFTAGSKWYLAGDASGNFGTLAVTGNVTLGNVEFHLDVQKVPASGQVTLVTAASISGSFSGAAIITVSGGAGRRLLGNGEVVVQQDSIVYRSGAASYSLVGVVAAFVLALM